MLSFPLALPLYGTLLTCAFFWKWQTAETIKQYFAASPSYVADPHTAVGLTVTQSLLPKLSVPLSSLLAHLIRTRGLTRPLYSALSASAANEVLVTLSTAHPAKFLSAVQSALPSLDFDAHVMPSELRGIEDKQRRVESVTDGEAGVRRVVERFAAEGRDVGIEIKEGGRTPPTEPSA